MKTLAVLLCLTLLVALFIDHSEGFSRRRSYRRRSSPSCRNLEQDDESIRSIIGELQEELKTREENKRRDEILEILDLDEE